MLRRMGGNVCFSVAVKHMIMAAVDSSVLYSSWLLREDAAITSSIRSPFVTLSSRHAQFGRISSFGKRVWLTELHIVLIISYFTYCFIY